MASKVRLAIESLFNIYNKDNVLVPFKLNGIQSQFDDEIITKVEEFEYKLKTGQEIHPEEVSHLRNSVLKYRQGGITTLVIAWYLIKCMQGYAVAVMLTHDNEASQKLLYRARIMLKHMNGPKPSTSKLNENEIAFAKTDSVFYIGTAGSKEFGRSATISFLHCSEIAFWKDPASLMKSLFQAVSKYGVITQETTANGWGNWFQRSYYGYLTGKGGFRPFFFAWYIHEEYYSIRPYAIEAVDPEERKEERCLYKRIRRQLPNLTRDQITAKLQWRREKIDENQGDQDRQTAIRDFNQEYPSTYQEAFTLTGGSLFGYVRLISTESWVHSGANTMRLVSHPRRGMEYVLGADFSGGTGNDNASINVLCVNTQEQVYRFAHNYIDPVAFAEKVCEVGKEFNEAYLIPESNSHGLAGIAIIKRNYNLFRIYKHIIQQGQITNAARNIPTYGYGWKTTGITKPYMVGIAQQFFRAGWTIYDPITENELRSFVEDPDTGRMAGQGEHDDCAMSIMLAFLGVLKLLRLDGKWIEDVQQGIEAELPVINIDTDVRAVKQLDTMAPTAPKTIECTWRDADGTYQTPFASMFKKGKRSVHA